MKIILQKLKLHFIRHWPLAIILIFFGWLFFSLLSSHMLYPKADGWYSGGSAWGDLAFHLNIITSFSERGFIPTLTQNPILAGASLVYPFASDYLSTLIYKTGVSLRSSLIAPSFIFLLLALALIYLLTLKITGSRISALIAPLILFFNGSIFGLYYFWRDFEASGLSLWQFLSAMPIQYAYVDALNIRFSNFLADYMMAQRHFIMGLAVGLVALYFLWLYWSEGTKRSLLAAGLFVSILPVIHAHTFIALIMAAGLLFAIRLIWQKKSFREVFTDWLFFSAPILVIGVPQLYFIFPSGRTGFFRFQFGWMKGSDSFLWFWIKNLTPHIFVFFWAWFRTKPELKTFSLAFLGVFVIANILVFQPYDYDNMKMLLWWYAASAIVVADFLGRMFAERSLEKAAIAGLILVSITIVGVLSVLREYNLSWQFLTSEDIALAEFVKKSAPKDALFLTSDDHRNPVTTLAGRRIVMGYRGWLWSHGLSYREQESDVLKMYGGGEESLALVRKYGVGYAVVEESKVAELGINKRFFEQKFPMIYRSAGYSVFRTD